MIAKEDRQRMAKDIGVAQDSGARLAPACALAGIDVRTLQRWKTVDGVERGDQRPHALHHRSGHVGFERERLCLPAPSHPQEA
ncbi:hypothetical protein DFR29_10388 [Tahibacter aquaticus]|uniref:Transposase n=1 Tax=Tahibacter aquaticus TaxID=520092 RepID=A0A4V3DMZ7_9GAMM|nr:hypothetical protein DFR29_10388 [Tahibacter aquaticus]